jgi:predicted transcriptional regulator
MGDEEIKAINARLDNLEAALVRTAAPHKSMLLKENKWRHLQGTRKDVMHLVSIGKNTARMVAKNLKLPEVDVRLFLTALYKDGFIDRVPIAYKWGFDYEYFVKEFNTKPIYDTEKTCGRHTLKARRVQVERHPIKCKKNMNRSNEILDLFKGNAMLTADEVAERLHINPSNANWQLNHLHNKNLVKRMTDEARKHKPFLYFGVHLAY